MNIKDLEGTLKTLIKIWAEEKNKQDQSIDKIRYSGPALGPEEYEAIMSAIFNNWWSGGKYTIEAEKKLAEISGRNHALLVNSGSSANLVMMEAMRHLYFNKGDKILTLACNFPTTANSIIKSELIPVFTDIDIESLNINPELIIDAKNKCGIRGVFIPHTLGFKNDINKILEIARKENLQVIFDACDAYGTKYDNNPIQQYGKAATLSFYVAHHITMGEGGAIVTNDADLMRVMRGLRNWGKYCSSDNCCTRSIDPNSFCSNNRLTLDAPIPNDYPVNYIYEWMGYNLKPLELQSAMLCCQIDKLDNFNEQRKKNYKLFFDYFKKSKFNFKLWPIDSDVSPFVFPLIIPEDSPFIRKHFVDYLKRNKVETRVLFAGNLTRHPAYYKRNDLYLTHGDLTNSNIIMERGLLFGVSHINNENIINRVIDIIDGFLKKW